jgi:hypothetical protein
MEVTEAVGAALYDFHLSVKAFGGAIGPIQSMKVLGQGIVSYHPLENGLKVTLPKDFDPETRYAINVKF